MESRFGASRPMKGMSGCTITIGFLHSPSVGRESLQHLSGLRKHRGRSSGSCTWIEATYPSRLPRRDQGDRGPTQMIRVHRVPLGLPCAISLPLAELARAREIFALLVEEPHERTVGE